MSLSAAMRIAPYLPVILLVLSLPPASQANPQAGAAELDLKLLDMNGSPFRSFHIGLYAEGLDDRRPAGATALPSEALQYRDPSLQGDAERYTGVATQPAGPMPIKSNIAPLLDRYDEYLLRPSAAD